LILVLLATGAVGEDVWPSDTPLRNVEITDRAGMSTRLAGFYRLSGEDFFRGFRGAGEVQVPYERVVEISVLAPAHPAGRMRAELTLRSGNVVEATFDEREGDQLLSGYASFGRVTLFFRDLRKVTFLGHTAREDLPDYGPPAEGHDVRVTDREGLSTELIAFRRAVGEDVIPGTRGAASVAIPLRIVRRLEISEGSGSPILHAAAALRDGTTLEFSLPSYVEETSYRGEAEFGTYRIRLGKLREILVHRATPVLDDIDPLAVAEEPEPVAEGRPER
jgi:hypothetical protein